MWLPSEWRFVVWPPREQHRAKKPKEPAKAHRGAKSKALRLSELQIDVLLLGAITSWTAVRSDGPMMTEFCQPTLCG
jgi:hypothetical protein